jgi:hypothetical protein
MKMDRLNAVTAFVSIAFVLSGLIGLSGLTDIFSVADSALFLGTGVAIFLVSVFRSVRASGSSNP